MARLRGAVQQGCRIPVDARLGRSYAPRGTACAAEERPAEEDEALSASEFAFMALGLLLGVASGAALMEVLRARPPAPREVRVTVAPDSVPRRASTLATSPFAGELPGPAPGGPADRRTLERPAGADGGDEGRRWTPREAPEALESGTSVRPTVRTAALATAPGPFRLAPGPSAVLAAPVGSMVGIAIEPEADPMFVALRAAEARAADVLRTRARAAPTRAARHAPPVATSADPADGTADPPTAARTDRVSGPSAGADPCAGQRHLTDERCAIATRAREGATVATQALHDAQRAYDLHREAAERAAATADARGVRRVKEDARAAFRQGRDRARTAADVEATATAWLTEINRINAEVREALVIASSEREAERALLPAIERLSTEADAARITAESAEETCLAARQALAECEEANDVAGVAGRFRGHSLAPGPPEDLEAPLRQPVEEEEPDRAASGGWERHALVIRLLRGDRAALQRLVAALGGDDPAERRRWQLAISDLTDAIVARSIEAAAFDFPTGHPFWGLFTRLQGREIAAALASLGYRFDGIGGFADDRIPSQRDLSLAVGYGGIDPMRIRRWPTEREMADLFREVTVAADEYLAGAAGNLTLGELVALLGRRADGLTDIWNAWGRIRPLLLSTD